MSDVQTTQEFLDNGGVIEYHPLPQYVEPNAYKAHREAGTNEVDELVDLLSNLKGTYYG